MTHQTQKTTFVKPELGKEEFVRHLFSKHAYDLGFEIINIQKAFPDCTAIDLRDNNNGKVYIEFEYEAQNFIRHGHEEQMQKDYKYIVVCWSGKGIDLIPSTIETIVLSDKKYKIDIKDYPVQANNEYDTPQYRIIGYNTNMASGLSFSAFENTKIFRTNIKFKEDRLPKGSVIVLYEQGWLIGEFTVEKYVYIENPPKTKREKHFYKLVGYPITIDDNPLDFYNWLKGHIIYTGFKVYDPPVNFSLLDRNMSRGGSIILSFDELMLIRGKRRMG